MRVQEELLAYTCAKVVENCDAEFRFLKKRFKPLKPPFPKITYSEAIDRLHKLNIPIEWGDGLGADEERALSKRPLLKIKDNKKWESKKKNYRAKLLEIKSSPEEN